MKVLIFGANGQVGQALQQLMPCTALSRVDADLSDPTSCANLIFDCNADVIINAAAYTAVDKAEENETLATIINGETPGAMARVCAKRDIPFLHISTDYVFDGLGQLPWPADAKTNPLSAYGRSKLAGENAVIAAGGRYAIMRTSWVFSAHGTNFVKTMLRLGQSRPELAIVDDQFGGPTSATSIAAALGVLAEKLLAGAAASGIYHFSGAPAASWKTFAEAIFEIAGIDVLVKGISTKDFPTPAKRPLNSRLDCQKIVNGLGIRQPDWRNELRRVLSELGFER